MEGVVEIAAKKGRVIVRRPLLSPLRFLYCRSPANVPLPNYAPRNDASLVGPRFNGTQTCLWRQPLADFLCKNLGFVAKPLRKRL